MDENDLHRRLGARFFNEVWSLLNMEDRSRDQDMQMVHLAHASRAHWQFAGGPREWVVGEWQVARVYAAIGRGEAAVIHATAALQRLGSGDDGPFLAASAHEGMARALRAAGRTADADDHAATALRLTETLEDSEERDLMIADLTGSRR
jgi:hypothetical protein